MSRVSSAATPNSTSPAELGCDCPRDSARNATQGSRRVGKAGGSCGLRSLRGEACLINRTEPGAKLPLHQDRDERNLDEPIVSVSLGVDATFLWGGRTRGNRPRRLVLHHGDVVVWGGPARLTFHGIDPRAESGHPSTGMLRYNLTFGTAA